MKTKSLILALVLGVALLVGCSNNTTGNTNNGTTTENKENVTTNDSDKTDVVSSASLASDEATLQKALKDS